MNKIRPISIEKLIENHFEKIGDKNPIEITELSILGKITLDILSTGQLPDCTVLLENLDNFKSLCVSDLHHHKCTTLMERIEEIQLFNFR